MNGKAWVVLLAALAAGGVFARPRKAPCADDMTGALPPEVKCVWIVAPSSQPPRGAIEKVTNGLVRAGCRVKVSEGVWKRPADGAKRARYLEEAWKDPEADLIICGCGGKGGYDTVTNLDFEILRSRDIPFVGFSNISCLMNAFVAKGVKRPISGPMCSSIAGYPTSRDSLLRLASTVARRPLEPVTLKVLRPAADAVTGRPAGGHWPSISRMDRAWLPSTEGRIVFLEINPNYDIEKAKATFAVLKEKGFFEKPSAVVLGTLGIKGTPEEKKELEKHIVDGVSCPVFGDYPYGHVRKLYAIDYDRPCTISKEGVLTWSDAAP